MYQKIFGHVSYMRYMKLPLSPCKFLRNIFPHNQMILHILILKNIRLIIKIGFHIIFVIIHMVRQKCGEHRNMWAHFCITKSLQLP